MNLPRLALLLPFILSSCAGVQLPKEKLGDVPGALLFNGYSNPKVECFKCHNGDGRGTWRGADLREEIPGADDAVLTGFVMDGTGWMPPQKEFLKAEELAQILAWLHTQFPDPAAAPAPAPAPSADAGIP